MRTTLSYCIGGLLLGLSFCLPAAAQEGPGWKAAFTGDFILELIESGEVQALRSRQVSAPMEWRSDLTLIRLAPEGSIAAEGDTLVQFDSAFLEEQLRVAHMQLEKDQAEQRKTAVQQAEQKVQLDNAVTRAEYQAELARLQLQQQQNESQAQREQSEMDLHKALISLEEARVKVRVQQTLDSLAWAQTELKILDDESRIRSEKAQADAMTLLAPGPGLVVHGEIGRRPARKIVQGDEIPPGVTVVIIPDLSEMEVVFGLHERDRERIADDMPVELHLEAYPDRRFTGTVTAIADLAISVERGSSLRTFQVRAKLDQSDPVLKPGMTAKIGILVERQADALQIPLECIFEKEGVPVVFPREGWPHPGEVQLGARNATAAVITGGDVQAGRDYSTRIPPDAEDVHPLGWQRWKEGLP